VNDGKARVLILRQQAELDFFRLFTDEFIGARNDSKREEGEKSRTCVRWTETTVFPGK